MSRARSIAKFGNESVIVADVNSNVGVGSTLPASKLDVSGSANITSGINIASGGINASSGVVTARSGIFTGGISLPTAPFVGFATFIGANYVTPANTNTLSVGPLVINSGIAVTVTSGTRWVIV